MDCRCFLLEAQLELRRYLWYQLDFLVDLHGEWLQDLGFQLADPCNWEYSKELLWTQCYSRFQYLVYGVLLEG